jgi:filamentous hemagglutinin family protein
MITKMIFDISRKAYIIFERIHFKQHRSNILRQIEGGDNLYLDGTIKIIVPNNLSLGNNVYIVQMLI